MEVVEGKMPLVWARFMPLRQEIAGYISDVSLSNPRAPRVLAQHMTSVRLSKGLLVL